MKTARDFSVELFHPWLEQHPASVQPLIEARDAEWQARIEAAEKRAYEVGRSAVETLAADFNTRVDAARVEGLREATVIAHSYTDGIASREAASVAHGIGEKIEALIAKAEGK